MTSNNRATKFSNLESNDIQVDTGKDVKCHNLDIYVLTVKDNSTHATEFSNVQNNGATKYSNSEMHNIMSKPLNPSTNEPINHENNNKSIQNDLISLCAGSGVPQM